MPLKRSAADWEIQGYRYCFCVRIASLVPYRNDRCMATRLFYSKAPDVWKHVRRFCCFHTAFAQSITASDSCPQDPTAYLQAIRTMRRLRRAHQPVPTAAAIRHPRRNNVCWQSIERLIWSVQEEADAPPSSLPTDPHFRRTSAILYALP